MIELNTLKLPKPNKMLGIKLPIVNITSKLEVIIDSNILANPIT